MLKTCEPDSVRVRFRFDHLIVGKAIGLYGALIVGFDVIGKNFRFTGTVLIKELNKLGVSGKGSPNISFTDAFAIFILFAGQDCIPGLIHANIVIFKDYFFQDCFKTYHHNSRLFDKSMCCGLGQFKSVFGKKVDDGKRLQLTITDKFSTHPSDNGSRWTVVPNKSTVNYSNFFQRCGSMSMKTLSGALGLTFVSRFKMSLKY